MIVVQGFYLYKLRHVSALNTVYLVVFLAHDSDTSNYIREFKRIIKIVVIELLLYLGVWGSAVIKALRH